MQSTIHTFFDVPFIYIDRCSTHNTRYFNKFHFDHSVLLSTNSTFIVTG